MAGVLILFVCFEGFFLLMIGAVSQVALETLIWWQIIMANVLATVAMFAVFSQRHPALIANLRQKVQIHGSLAAMRASDRPQVTTVPHLHRRDREAYGSVG